MTASVTASTTVSEPRLKRMCFKVIHADCIATMRGMDDNSIDSICTDPPYELGFMGKQWDRTGITRGVEVWSEALRVLKPGGYLLAFGGARTYHRMVCAIEDAGFEIRDQIMWIYGSGFPKSLDVSKAIDKAAGAEREVVGVAGKSGGGRSCMNDAPGNGRKKDYLAGEYMETAPATDAARQWEGWGTALKPAHEPIVVARKPLIGTVAANVLAHGTGALNIDGCRIHGGERPHRERRKDETLDESRNTFGRGLNGSLAVENTTLGRWPANLIHDGSDEVLAAFPQAPGQLAAESFDAPSGKTRNVFGVRGRRPGGFANVGAERGSPIPNGLMYGDSGSAARFFYCAKASRTERNAGLPSGMNNTHPTVKPVAVCAYLQRLVTPPGGTVLDPFAGSGSFGVAAMREGFQYIGIDDDIASVHLARARIASEADDGLSEGLHFDDGLDL